MQKSHQGQRARRVRIGASCASIATEYLLHLFIGSQVSSRGAFLNNFPFFVADLIVSAPHFNLADNSRQLLLIGRRPIHHAIENLFHLISGHVDSIAHCPFSAPTSKRNHRTFTFSSAHSRFVEARLRLSGFATQPKSLNVLAGAGGFEPPNGGIKIRCLTTWLRPNARCRNAAGGSPAARRTITARSQGINPAINPAVNARHDAYRRPAAPLY